MSSEHKTIGIAALLIPAAICAVALAIGYRAHTAAHTAQKQLASVTEELGGLKTQIAALSNALAGIPRKATTIVSTTSGGGGEWASSKDDLSDSLMALESSVSSIQKTLDKTGLEGVASNDVDQAALREIVGEYSDRKMVEIKREQMEKLHTAQRAADMEKYGADLTNLFAQARGGWRGRDRNEAEDQQREAALKQLQDKYPESYATAVALSERAVGAMFQQKTEQVEQYYKQLSDMKQSAQVVTEWGMQAMPTIEYYLADKYISEKRYSEAEKLIASMEKNYSGALVPSMMAGGGRGRHGGGDHGPGWTPISRALPALREKMQQ